MNEYPLLIAFAFDRTPRYPVYKVGADKLRARCKELKLDADICMLDLWKYMDEFKKRNPLTTTERRIIYRHIPMFIHDKLSKYKRPVLYLHCDTIINTVPPLSTFESPMNVGYAFADKRAGMEGLHASPLYFRPSNTAELFLDIWATKCQMINSDVSEHYLLGLTVKDFVGTTDVLAYKGMVASESPEDKPMFLHGQGVPKPKFL